MKPILAFVIGMSALVVAMLAFVLHDPTPDLVQIGPYTFRDAKGCEWIKSNGITGRSVDEHGKPICHPKQ